jgi:hypothetical protein
VSIPWVARHFDSLDGFAQLDVIATLKRLPSVAVADLRALRASKQLIVCGAKLWKHGAFVIDRLRRS